MYCIAKKIEDSIYFYRFFSDETDLCCTLTDNLDTTPKYTLEEATRLSKSHLMKLRGVKFYKVELTLSTEF